MYCSVQSAVGADAARIENTDGFELVLINATLSETSRNLRIALIIS